MRHTVCIMAGGGGTRLFPLSRTDGGRLPKQFLSVIKGETLLQKTIRRIPESFRLMVIPEARYVEAVGAQAEQLGREITVLDEPFGCNTAAAILYTAAMSYFTEGLEHPEDQVLCFIPADHEMDSALFGRLITQAADSAAQTDRVVTIGISPTKPETNYGYIKVRDGSSGKDGLFEVDRFVEKPDRETAVSYLAEGGYYWNAGIFAAKASVFVDAARSACPEILAPLLEAADPGSPMTQTEAYTRIKQAGLNKSIDYALMERIAESILLIPAPRELAWNDLGNWESLTPYMEADGEGNHWFSGSPVELQDCSGAMVCNYTEEPVVIKGMRDVVVVVTDQGVLIRPTEAE